ncbi:MAG: 30S ribosomal protein S6 [Candidatus Bipolaricaulota bacterium]|nr:30S ribosomal protein S6 [Candidatus Bipolaricaulota bacterium]
MNNLKGYEVMYLLDPELEEEGLDEKKERLRSIVESSQGEVQSMEEWGKKRLAYEIQGFNKGLYLLVEFKASSDDIDEISDKSNVEEGVIRYQIFRNDELAEAVSA